MLEKDGIIARHNGRQRSWTVEISSQTDQDGDTIASKKA